MANGPPGCIPSSFLRNSRADNGTQDRAPGCALRGAYRGSVLGLFLVASNRARSGWSLKRFRWVKISMHNAWKGVSERQGIHLALFFSLVSHLVAYFSHQQCLFCSIYIFRCRMISNIRDWQGGFLPASWHSLTIPKRVGFPSSFLSGYNGWKSQLTEDPNVYRQSLAKTRS